MSKDAGVRPLSEILYSLSQHVQNRDSGVFFLYGEGVVGWVHLNEGRYEDVVMQNRHSDEAVALLMNVREASCRFQHGKVFPGNHPPLSETAKGLLAAGAKAPAPAPISARPVVSAPAFAPPRPSVAAPVAPVAPAKPSPQNKLLQMQVEKLATAYLGPMASIICQEAWEDHGMSFSAILAIAENLSGDARETFLADVRKTTG